MCTVPSGQGIIIVLIKSLQLGIDAVSGMIGPLNITCTEEGL